MSNLLKLYESRLHGITLDDEASLENLLVSDEKTFYFALMYFFLTRKDLGLIFRKNVILSNTVTLFCQSCNDPSVFAYYSKYTDLYEVPDQCRKIYKEWRYNNIKGDKHCD